MRFLGFRFNFGRRSRASTTIYCEICMERVPSTSSFKTTAQRRHSFCSRCLSSYITLRIGDGVANVPCPGLNCQARLNPLRCKKLLSHKSFLRWCDVLCESHVLDFAKRRCPNCRELIVNECGQSGNVKRFKCPNCCRRGRFRCASAWAKGHRCGRTHDVQGHRCSRTHDEELILFERLADRKKWPQCPNCRMYVERIGGCDVIYCRCLTQFCYRCGLKMGDAFHDCARKLVRQP